MASFGAQLKAAFMAPANLLGLLAAGGAAAITGDPLPAMVALGMEGLYLGLVSSSPRLRRVASAGGRVGPHERQPQDLIEQLAPSQREHYLALRELRDKILANHRQLPGGRVLAVSSEQRVDALLTSFLRLVATLNHHRKYLNAADRRAVERDLADLEAELGAEGNERVREVMAKRVEILRKRLQRFQQAQESREVVSHQIAGIEDLLKLTHEQSIALRDPESVGRQLEALALEAEATEETVRQMERFMEIEEVSSAPVRHGGRVR